MSLVSPFSGIRGSKCSSSTASSAHADAHSDGYFSEVFEGEGMDDIDSTATLSDTMTTLINAPLANSPVPSTAGGKVCMLKLLWI